MFLYYMSYSNYTQITSTSGLGLQTDYPFCICSYDGIEMFYFKQQDTQNMYITYSNDYGNTWTTISRGSTSVGTEIKYIASNYNGTIFYLFGVIGSSCMLYKLSATIGNNNVYSFGNISNVSNAVSLVARNRSSTAKVQLSPDGEIIVWAFGYNNRVNGCDIVISTDSGGSWSLTNLSEPRELTCACNISGTKSCIYYMCGNYVYKASSPNYTTFNLIATLSLTAVPYEIVSSFSDTNIVYFLLNDGKVYKSINGLQNSSLIATTTTTGTVSLCSNYDCSYLIASNNTATINYSINGGVSFNPLVINNSGGGLSACAKYITTISEINYTNSSIKSGTNIFYNLLPACYLGSSLVLNEYDELVKVETLKENDIVKTSNGYYKVDKLKTFKLLKNENILKVLRKNKLSLNVPNEDLFITDTHSVLLNDLKIKVSECDLFEKFDIDELNVDKDYIVYDIALKDYDKNTTQIYLILNGLYVDI